MTITSTFIGDSSTNDSRSVVVNGGAASGATVKLWADMTDSANIVSSKFVMAKSTTLNELSGTANILAASTGDTFIATAAGTYTKLVTNVQFRTPTTAGTYVFTVVQQSLNGAVIYKTATFTLTVTAGNTTPTVANSGIQLTDTNRSTFVTALTGSDSSIVATAGTVGSNSHVANIVWSQLNSDSVATTTGGRAVGEQVVATIVSGPGTLAAGSAGCGTATQATVSSKDYLVVCNDGRPGVTSISLKTTSMNPWATKSVTFYSTTVDSFTLATSQTNAAGTLPLTTGTLASPYTLSNGLRVTAKDAAASVIYSGALVYLYSSDTKIVSNYGGRCSTSVFTAKTYYTCDLTLVDSGTVTLTVGDSTTIAKSVKTATISVTVAGNAFTPTVALDKTSYTPGEKVTLTMTAKDSRGTVVADNSDNTAPFATGYTALEWRTGAATFTSTTAAEAAGGTFTDIKDYVGGGTTYPTYVAGTDTAIAYAPTTPGTYTLFGKVGSATTATQLLTFTVVDATKDAADAATDAALEATDAAYAAQDAAQLAAEAADAATAAAEAATAAVEDLATQVASLFADLQKQITTLANVVAKIAKKVKA